MTDDEKSALGAGMRAGAEAQNRLVLLPPDAPEYVAAAELVSKAVSDATVRLLGAAHPPSLMATAMIYEAVQTTVSIHMAAGADMGELHDQLHAMVCDAFERNVARAAARIADLEQKQRAWFAAPAGHA